MVDKGYVILVCFDGYSLYPMSFNKFYFSDKKKIVDKGYFDVFFIGKINEFEKHQNYPHKKQS